MKLLYLTDLHFRTLPNSFQEALEVVESESPDVLLLGGDYESWEYLWLFLKSAGCPEKRKAVFILGNNDEYELTPDICSKFPAVYLDMVQYVVFNEASPKIVVTGFSRNFSLREKQWSITVKQAVSKAHEIRRVLPPDGVRVVLLHEVPMELITAARAVKPDLRFNHRVADAASRVAEILDADLVLVGHLHIPGLDPLAPEIARRDSTRVFILATWPNKNYVVVECADDHVNVEVRKYPSQSTLIRKRIRPRTRSQE